MTLASGAEPQVSVFPFWAWDPWWWGGGGRVYTVITCERISLLLRWLFSSEKICESFLKVDNLSLGGQERGQESAAGKVRAALGRTFRLSGKPPPPSTAYCARAPPSPQPLYLLTAPQLRLSRYMGLDCRADSIARSEEKFRSSRQRCGWAGSR